LWQPAASSAPQACSKRLRNYRFWQVYQRVHHFCSIDMGAYYLDLETGDGYGSAARQILKKHEAKMLFGAAA